MAPQIPETMPVPELVPITELKRHPQNPRRGDVDTLRALIRENGWVGVVYRQASTGYVVSGWHSSQAAAAEGYETLPVVTLDVDDRRALKLLISLNRGHEVGHTDEGDLADVLRLLAEDDDLDGLGFADDDVDSLLADGFGDEAAGFLSGLDAEDDSDDAGASTTPEGNDGGNDVAPSGTTEKAEPVYFQLGYTVTLEQRADVMAALKAAREKHGDDTPSAELLACIARAYLER